MLADTTASQRRQKMAAVGRYPPLVTYASIAMAAFDDNIQAR